MIGLFILGSCKKAPQDFNNDNEYSLNLPDKDLYKIHYKLGKTSEEILRQAILELTEVNKKISKEGYLELRYLLKNNYYKDYYVGLNDLLSLNEEVYKSTKCPDNLKGKYLSSFNIVFNELKYPNLAYILSSSNGNYQRSSSHPQFLNQDGLFFYMPYQENDDGIPFSNNANPTYVPAVADSQAGYGWIKQSDDTWYMVATDDNYAASTPTIIVTVERSGDLEGGTPGEPDIDYDYLDSIARVTCNNLENQTLLRQVFVGHAILKKQMDAYISFTRNGDGSEIVIGRVGSREHVLNTTSNDPDVNIDYFDSMAQFYFPRSVIRKAKKGKPGGVKWLGMLWDINWECGSPFEQGMVVYEADNTDSNWTINLPEIEYKSIKAKVNFSFEARRKEEVIILHKFRGDEFFVTALLDQGHGCKNGLGDFGSDCWPWYFSGEDPDSGAIFGFTMPYRFVNNNN